LNQHPFWLGWRAVIVGLFVAIVGVSVMLSPAYNWRSLVKRVGIIGGAAVAISGVSYGLFGSRFIFFGILHFIALASIIAVLFRRAYGFNLILGVSLWLIGVTVQHEFFNQAQWQWFGLMTHKPATEDYVPFLPWFGVVLVGMFAGRYLQLHPTCCFISNNKLTQSLSQLGQYSLWIYLLHQPILFALFGLLQWLLSE
jgi:uncharacterized membrane protein